MIIALIPKKLLKRIADKEKAYAVNVLVSAVLVLGLLYAYKAISAAHSGLWFCLSQRLLGIPCVGCGISRSLFSLYELRVFDSIMYNPCGILFFASIVLQIPLMALVLTKKIKFANVHRLNKACTILMLCVLCAAWLLRLIFPELLYPL